MKADERLIFRLPASKKAEFMAKVEREGKKPSEVLNELVEKYLEEPENVSDLHQFNIRLQKLEEIVMGESAA